MQKLSNSQPNPVTSPSYRPPPLSRALVSQSFSSLAAPPKQQIQQQQTAQQVAVAAGAGSRAGGGVGSAPYSSGPPSSFSFSPPPAIAALTSSIIAGSSGSNNNNNNSNSTNKNANSVGGGGGSSGSTTNYSNSNLGFRGDLANLVKVCEGIGQNAYSLEMAFVMVAVDPHLSEPQRAQFISIVDVSLCQMLGRLRNLRERREALSAFSEAVFLESEIRKGKGRERTTKETEQKRRSEEAPLIDSTLARKKQQFDDNLNNNTTHVGNKQASASVAAVPEDGDSFSSHHLLAKASEVSAVSPKQGKASERRASPQILEGGQVRSGFAETSGNESGGGGGESGNGGGGGGRDLGFSLNSPISQRNQNAKKKKKKEGAEEVEEEKKIFVVEEAPVCTTTAAAVTNAKDVVVSMAMPTTPTTTTPYERQVLIVRQLLELHAAHNVFMRQYREREKEKARLRAGGGGGENGKDTYQTTSRQNSHLQREKGQRQQQQQYGGGGGAAAALTTPINATAATISTASVPQPPPQVQASGTAAVTAPPSSSSLSTTNAPNTSSSSSSRIASAAQQLLITQTVRLMVYGYVLSPSTTNTTTTTATASSSSSTVPSLLAPTATTNTTVVNVSTVAGGAAGADTSSNTNNNTNTNNNYTNNTNNYNSTKDPLSSTTLSAIPPPATPTADETLAANTNNNNNNKGGGSATDNKKTPAAAASANTNNSTNVENSGPNHYNLGYYFTAFPSPVVALMPITDFNSPLFSSPEVNSVGRATHVPVPVSDFTTEDTLLRRLYRLPLATLASAAATFGFATPRLIVDGVTMPPPTKATSKLRGALEIELIYSEYLRDGRDPTFGGRREGGGDGSSGVPSASSVAALTSLPTSEQQYQHPHQGGAKKSTTGSEAYHQHYFSYLSQQHHQSVVLTHLPSPAATAYFTQNATAEMRQRALLAMAATMWVNNAIEKGVRLAEAAAADLDSLLTAASNLRGFERINERNEEKEEEEERRTSSSGKQQQPSSSCVVPTAHASQQSSERKNSNFGTNENGVGGKSRAGEEIKEGEAEEVVLTTTEVVQVMGAFTSPSSLPFYSHDPYPDSLSPSPPPPTAISVSNNTTTTPAATASTVATEGTRDADAEASFGAFAVSQEGQGKETEGEREPPLGDEEEGREGEVTIVEERVRSGFKDMSKVNSMTSTTDEAVVVDGEAEADGGIGGTDVGLEDALGSKEELGKPRDAAAAACTNRKRRCGTKAARRQLRMLMEIADSATKLNTSSIPLRNLKEASFHELFLATSTPCVPQANTTPSPSIRASTGSSSALVLPIPRLEALIRDAPSTVDYLVSQQCAEVANLVFRAVSTTVDLLIPAAAGGGGSGSGGGGEEGSSNSGSGYNHRAVAVIMYRKWIYDLLRAVTDYEDCCPAKDTFASLSSSDGEEEDGEDNKRRGGYLSREKRSRGGSYKVRDLTDKTTAMSKMSEMGEINHYYLKLIELHTNTNANTNKTTMRRSSSSTSLSSSSSTAVSGGEGGEAQKRKANRADCCATVAAETKFLIKMRKKGRKRGEHEAFRRSGRRVHGCSTAAEGELSHSCKTHRKREKKSLARGCIISRAQQEKHQQQQRDHNGVDTRRCEDRLRLDRHVVCPGVVTSTTENASKNSAQRQGGDDSKPLIISSSGAGSRPLVIGFRPIFLGSSTSSSGSSSSENTRHHPHHYHNNNVHSRDSESKRTEEEENNKNNNRGSPHKQDDDDERDYCHDCILLGSLCRSHRHRRHIQRTRQHHHNCHRGPQCVKLPKAPHPLPEREEESSSLSRVALPTTDVGEHPTKILVSGGCRAPPNCCSPSLFLSSASKSPSSSSCCSFFSSSFSSSTSLSSRSCSSFSSSSSSSRKGLPLEKRNTKSRCNNNRHHLNVLEESVGKRKSGTSEEVLLFPSPPRERKLTAVFLPAESSEEREKEKVVTKANEMDYGGIIEQRGNKLDSLAPQQHLKEEKEADYYERGGMQTPTRRRRRHREKSRETDSQRKVVVEVGTQKERERQSAALGTRSGGGEAMMEDDDVSSHSSSYSGSKTPARGRASAQAPQGETPPPARKRQQRETRNSKASSPVMPPVSSSAATAEGAELGLVSSRPPSPPRQIFGLTTPQDLSSSSPSRSSDLAGNEAAKTDTRETRRKMKSKRKQRLRIKEAEEAAQEEIKGKARRHQSRVAVATRMLLSLALPIGTATTHNKSNSNKASADKERRRRKSLISRCSKEGSRVNPTYDAEVHLSEQPPTATSSLLSPSLFHFHSYRQITVRSREDVAAGYAAVLAEAATALHPAHPVRAALVNNAADHVASSLGKIKEAIKLIESYLAEVSSEALMININTNAITNNNSLASLTQSGRGVGDGEGAGRVGGGGSGGVKNSGSIQPVVGMGDTNNEKGMFATSSSITGVGVGGGGQSADPRKSITTSTTGTGGVPFAENPKGAPKATIRFEGDASRADSQSLSPTRGDSAGGAVAVAGVTLVPPSVLSTKREDFLNDPLGKKSNKKGATSDSQTFATATAPSLFAGNSVGSTTPVAANIAGGTSLMTVTAPSASAGAVFSATTTSPPPLSISVGVGVGTTVASAVMSDILVVEGGMMMRAGVSNSTMTASSSSAGIVPSSLKKASSSSPEKSGVVVGVVASSTPPTSTSPVPQGGQTSSVSATLKTKGYDALAPTRSSSGAFVIIPIESLSASAAGLATAATLDDTNVASRGVGEVPSLSMPVGNQQKKSAFTTSSAARGVGASSPPQNAAKAAASTTTALVSGEFGDAGGTLFLTAAAVGVLDEELMETKFILRMLTQSLGVLRQLV